MGLERPSRQGGRGTEQVVVVLGVMEMEWAGVAPFWTGRQVAVTPRLSWRKIVLVT